MEDTDYYFVLKFFYDDFNDVQEVIGAVSFILAGEGIYRYTVTLNCND